MRYVPWHVKGVRREVRGAARDAARRSGFSVGAWLHPLAVLSGEMKALSDKIDRTSRPPADSDLMNALERRLAEIAQAVGSFNAQSDRREGADRRMEELLEQLRELRQQNESRLAAIQQQIATSAADIISRPAESVRRDVASLKEIQTAVDQRTRDTFEAVHGTIEQMVDRLAVIEDELRDQQFTSHPGRLADERQWPDSGARRVRLVANAIDRIAASEAVNAIAKPAETSAPVRAKFVAAARRAAEAVVSEHKGTPPPPYPPLSATLPSPACGGGKGRAAGEGREGEKLGPDATRNSVSGTLFTRLKPRTKSVVLGVSTVLLMFGALRLAVDFFHTPAALESVQSATRTDDTAQRGGEWVRLGQSPPAQPPALEGVNIESPASPVRHNASALPGETAPGQGLGWAGPPDMAPPAAIPAWAATQTAAATPYPPPQAGEGRSIDPPTLAGEARVGRVSSPVPNVLFHGPAARDSASPYTSSAAPDPTATPLPPTIGGKALLTAASAGDPSACYEIAMRFAQGRNTTQDLAMAAAWLERAARGGLAPAQFRLGSMYEKGLGVKKDVAEARRLYVAAADKGHAKAMHNLAVLYAAGLDGKPDYAVASQWFRRAASHGIVDSQYNLAILYARGIGIERNLAESYKWFALAAKGGDHDAARKRDEVAMRLDPKQLEGAKLNAESFVAVPQPHQSTVINAPPGGWDQAVAAATTKSKVIARPERLPGKQEPSTR